MARLTLVLAGFALALWSVGIQPARADAAGEARALFNQGVAHYEAGQYEQALDAFQRAYRMRPHPVVRLDMGHCFEKLGRYAEAVFNYERFLSESDDVPPQQRQEVQAAIDRLEAQLGTLDLNVRPSKARVRIDGGKARTTPDGSLRLAEGGHEVEVFANGYSSQRHEVQIVGGQPTSLNVQLEPEPQPVAETRPALPAVSETAPDPTPAPAAATSELPRDDRQSRSKRTAAWVLGGGSVAMAIGAGVTGALALDAENDFESAVQQSNDPDASAQARETAVAAGQDAADRADLHATLSDSLLAGAAVAGVTGLVLWLLDRRESSEQRAVRTRTTFHARGAALSVEGRF